jgi:hypothetical protein
MKLTIFGATGPSGQLLVNKALAAGHEVTVFARNPSKLTARSEKLHIVSGEITDAASVEKAALARHARRLRARAARREDLGAEVPGHLQRLTDACPRPLSPRRLLPHRRRGARSSYSVRQVDCLLAGWPSDSPPAVLRGVLACLEPNRQGESLTPTLPINRVHRMVVRGVVS